MARTIKTQSGKLNSHKPIARITVSFREWRAGGGAARARGTRREEEGSPDHAGLRLRAVSLPWAPWLAADQTRPASMTFLRVFALCDGVYGMFDLRLSSQTKCSAKYVLEHI
jgi:hypothetical protein